MSGWRRTIGRSKLQQRYYDPKCDGSYGGVAALRRVVPKQDVERWLSEQDTYTLHKPSRPTRHVAVEDDQRWNNIHTDCDRCVFQNSLVRSAKEQVSSLVGGSLYTVAKQRAPNTLQTDKGTTFLNRSLQELLNENGVHHFATHNGETKASIVERFNRTLKTRMWRYFTKAQSVRYVDVLQAFMRSYNDTYHRSIGLAPSEVTSTNHEAV